MTKPRKRTKVREVFETQLGSCAVKGVALLLRYMHEFKPGDRVQVVVTLLEREPK